MFSGEGFIGLGSNEGGPYCQITAALKHLDGRSVSVKQVSSLYRTEPVDAPPQPWFINAVARIVSPLEPHALLALCLDIERMQGRERRVHHGPRTIDLDVLMAGEVPFSSPQLTVPHPELHRRRFVLIPLSEIAPDWTHPTLGLTAKVLLQRCRDRSTVIRVGPPPQS